MDHLTEEQIASKQIYSGKVVNLYVDEVRLPNGKTAVRETIRHRGAVCIVALTDQNEVLMVKQCRHPFGRVIVEVPAGKLDPGESPASCAVRELSEETGAAARSMVFIGEYYPSPAVLDEVIYMFLAQGLTYGQAHTDEDEFLSIEKVPIGRLVDGILNGEVKDGKTQAAVLKAWIMLQRRNRII
jgi:ADP-ribose pyrophosphatase